MLSFFLPAVAEELLLSLFKVTRRALQFTDEYRSRTPSYESLLAYQCRSSPEDTTVNDMSKFLIQALDELCIPVIMVNFQAVENPEIFEIFYTVISNHISPEVSGSSVLGRKLIASSFLRLSLDVKAKFCQAEANKELSLQVSRLLRNLCLISCEDSEQEQIKELLDCKADGFPNSPSACLMFLTQSSVHPQSAEVTDTSLFNIQCLCIELLYISSICDDLFIPEDTLLTTLKRYLVLHPNISCLPLITLKHLTHLYVICYKKLWGNPQFATSEMGNLPESQDVLSQRLSEAPVHLFEKIFIPDVSFLEWIFSCELLAIKYGQSTLMKWLKMDAEIEDQAESSLASKQIFLRLLRCNRFCFRDLLALVTSTDHVIVSGVLQVLEDLFNKQNKVEECQENPPFISLINCVTEAFHKLFLCHQTGSLESNCLSAMIKILTTILMRSEELDIKLIHHIVNMVTTRQESPDVLLASFNFLNVLLTETRRRGQTSIATFLLSNKALCDTLQHLLDTLPDGPTKQSTHSTDVNLYSSALLLVAQLVKCQAELRIVSGYVFRAAKECLISLLNQSQSVLGVAALVLWKCIFNAKLGRESCCFELSVGQSTAKLTSIDFQAVLVYIQNCLVHESETVRQTAVSCLEGLLLFVQKPCQYADNPWNRVVLAAQLSVLDSNALQPSFVQLCILLVQHSTIDPSDGLCLLQTSVDGILQKIPLLQPDNQDITWLCVRFLKEVVHIIGAASLFASQKDSIFKWLEQVDDLLASPTCKQHPNLPVSHDRYLTLDTTLFSADMVKVRFSKDRESISWLAAKLRGIH